MTEERETKIKEFTSWKHDFAVAVYNISKEFNIGSLLRTSHCAKANEFFLIGEKSFNTYASVSCEKWTEVKYFPSIDDFICDPIVRQYSLILVEQSKDSTLLFDFEFPQKPLFLLGTERGGLPEKLKKMSFPVLEIPQYGLIPSLNLSCAGSIVIYHYLYKLYKKTKTNSNIEDKNVLLKG